MVRYNQPVVIYSYPTRVAGSTSRVSHSHGWHIDAGYWLGAPPLVDLSAELIECPHRLVTGFPQDKESEVKTQVSMPLMTQPSKSHISLLSLYSVGLVESALIWGEKYLGPEYWEAWTMQHLRG